MTVKTNDKTQSKSKSARTPTHGPGTRSSLQTQKILEWIDETFEIIVYPDGFEDCIVGVAEKFGGPPVAVLDLEKILSKLRKEGMTYEKAIEYFEYNILGSYLGDQTPVYMHVPNFKTNQGRKRKEKK